jgi:hypothetical protein
MKTYKQKLQYKLTMERDFASGRFKKMKHPRFAKAKNYWQGYENAMTAALFYVENMKKKDPSDDL